MQSSEATPRIDTTACDREPIHLIASIQDSGFLLAVSREDWKICNASRNAAAALGEDPEAVLVGRRLESLIPEAVMDSIQRILTQLGSEGVHRRIDADLDGKGEAAHDLHVFSSDRLIVIEFEQIPEEGAEAVDGDTVIRSSIEQMQSAPGITEAARVLASGFRSITGMDRVMVYHFLPGSWHGEVIAEDRVASSQAFLGHRFPASDIPKQARALYLKNRIRLIPDVNGSVFPVQPAENPLTGKTLDLSDSRLRAVSPVHLEYLRNMEVGSSFSVAILVKGELWGLIACHHFEPRRLPHRLRSFCEVLANAFSLRITNEAELKRAEKRLEFELKLREILSLLKDRSDPIPGLFQLHSRVQEAFETRGIALVQRQEVEVAGLTPPSEAILKLAALARSELAGSGRRLWIRQTLHEAGPEWEMFREQVSGAIAVTSPESPDRMLFLFRPETAETIQWGGDPRKALDRRDYQGPINPRKSFESWTEQIEGQSLPWEPHVTAGAEILWDFVIDSFQRKESMLKELSDRVHGGNP